MGHRLACGAVYGVVGQLWGRLWGTGQAMGQLWGRLRLWGIYRAGYGAQI